MISVSEYFNSTKNVAKDIIYPYTECALAAFLNHMHARTHGRMHTCMHAHTDVCTHACTHTHTVISILQRNHVVAGHGLLPTCAAALSFCQKSILTWHSTFFTKPSTVNIAIKEIKQSCIVSDDYINYARQVHVSDIKFILSWTSLV